MSSAARYYVVYEDDPERPWKVMVSAPYASGDGGTVIRKFSRKTNAVAYAKRVAKNNNERVAVNKRNGATHKHYDYS